MTVLGIAVLDDAKRAYPFARSAISRWKTITEGANWRHFGDIKHHFNAPDHVGKCVVFDIKHNDFRLIAIVDYARALVIVKPFSRTRTIQRTNGKMSAAADYGVLLEEIKPQVPHADEQYRYLLERLSAFVLRENLSEAEEKVVELLTLLVREYERVRFEKIESAPGIDIVKYLMQHQGLNNQALIPSGSDTASVPSP